MIATADRMADAWLDAMTSLTTATPQGWYAKWGSSRALVTKAAVAPLNLAVTLAPEPGRRSILSLDAVATEVRRFELPWSLVACGQASDKVAALAARHGLTHRGEITMMACSAEDAVLQADAGKIATIHTVGSDASAAYTDALTAGFGVPAGAFGTLMGGLVLDEPSITGYLAGPLTSPTGTGLGVMSGDVVGVYNIAVVPRERGHGLGRAMTATVLADGFAAGATAAYLHTSAAGRPLYESMGFRVVDRWTAFTEA